MRRCLICLLLMLFCRMLPAQITYETVRVDYDSVWNYKNLTVIPIRAIGDGSGGLGDFITLKQGLQSGLITVNERGSASTENVHWVRIINHSKLPVYVGAGEILTGGRQDRMLTRDTLLMPSGRDQYIPAMCVEENRWSERERKFFYGGYANPKLRKVLDVSGNQLLIWKEIYAQLDSSNINSSTLAYGARKLDKKHMAEVTEYLRFFEQKLKQDSSLLGFVCISGKRILGTDIYLSSVLFNEQAPELLAGYIEEAIAFGSVPEVKTDRIVRYMDNYLLNERTQEENCRKNGMIHKIGGKVIHITGYGKEE